MVYNLVQTVADALLELMLCLIDRDILSWGRDKRHDLEQHIYFLLGSTPVNREGWSAALFPLRRTWGDSNFQIKQECYFSMSSNAVLPLKNPLNVLIVISLQI